jgi:hypothetical protein
VISRVEAKFKMSQNHKYRYRRRPSGTRR